MIFFSLQISAPKKIDRSYGNSTFNVLRNLWNTASSGCINLHSHQWCRRHPFSPHPCQHLLLVVFLIIAILIGVRWYLIVVLCFHFSLFCVFFGHLYVFFGKMFIQILCPCLNWVVFYIELLEFCGYVWLLLTFWILTPYQICGLQISSPIQLTALSICWSFPSLCKSFLVCCSPICLFLFPLPEKTDPKNIAGWMSKNELPMFYSRSFMVLGLTFNFLVNFELFL